MESTQSWMYKLTNEKEMYGNISFTFETAHSLSLTWTIPEFFSLPNTPDYSMDSGSFVFANATWCLRLHPNDKLGTFVSLVRLRSLVARHEVICKFDVLLTDGKHVKDECDYRKSSYSKLSYNKYALHHKLHIGEIYNKAGLSSSIKIYIPDGCLTLDCHLVSEETKDLDQLLKKCEHDCGIISRSAPEMNQNHPEMLEYSSMLSLRPATAQSIKILWQIPDYFSLPDNLGYSITSPSLNFGYATWFLKLYPNGTKNDSVPGAEDTNMSLVRLHSLVASLHEIVYAFGIQVMNEEQHYVEYSKFSFNENRELPDVHLGFDDRSRSDLFADRSRIAPGGNVTFSAHLFCEESTLNDQVVRKMAHELDSYRTHGQDLKSLLLTGKDSDLTLKVKGKEFRVHRHILYARSQVFGCMLTHDMNEKSSGVVDIPDCDPHAIEQFLSYVYSGKVDALNQSNMLGLYYVADKYNMMQLKEDCRDFIQNALSCSNVGDVFQVAKSHCDENLHEWAILFFSENSNEILTTPEWISFKKGNEDIANDLLNRASKRCYKLTVNSS